MQKKEETDSHILFDCLNIARLNEIFDLLLPGVLGTTVFLLGPYKERRVYLLNNIEEGTISLSDYGALGMKPTLSV